MTDNNWFVSVRGFSDRKSVGPLSKGQVLQLFRDGTIGMKSSVAHHIETSNKWVELRTTVLAAEAQEILGLQAAETELKSAIANDERQETKRKKQQQQQAARQKRDEETARRAEQLAAVNEERRQQEQIQQQAEEAARRAREADIVMTVKSESVVGTILASAFYAFGWLSFIVFTWLAIAGNNLAAGERGYLFGYGLGGALSMFAVACALQFFKDIRDDNRITRLRSDKADAERDEQRNSW